MPSRSNVQPLLSSAVLAIVSLILVTTLAVHGWYSAFLIYAPYDDEGYLMLSRDIVQEGGALYSEVYAQHGPFYFVYHLVLHALTGIEVSHTVTRMLSVAHWLVATGLCALVAYRLSGSWLAAGLTFFFTAGHLQTMFYSAGHPQELIANLTPLAVLLATGMRQATLKGFCAAGLGAIAASLLLTKINVGLFFALALAYSFFLALPRSRLTIAGGWTVLALALVAPAALMQEDALPGGWAFPMGAAVFLGVIAIALSARAGDANGEISPNVPLIAAGIAIFAGTSIGGVILARGTSLSDLIDGVVLNPLRFHQSYAHPRTHSLPGALLSLAGCAASAFVAFRPAIMERRMARLVLATIAIAVSIATLSCAWTRQPEIIVAVAMPFLWLLLAMRVEPRGFRFARLLLAFTAVLYTLQSYPWSGSQLYMATFLALPIASILCIDALRIAGEEWLPRSRFAAVAVRWRALPASAIVVALVIARYGAPLQQTIETYAHAEPLGLTGADYIRPAYSSLDAVLVSSDIVPALNAIANNLCAHCDTFITVPGLYSFHFWSRVSPPTGLNAGQWMTLFDDAQQQFVVDALASFERPCVLYNAELVKFWQGGDAQIAGPLVDYIGTNFRTIQRIGTYEFMVENDRPIDPLYISLLAWERGFDGSDGGMRLPAGLIGGFPETTLSGRFRTVSPGVILGLDTGRGEARPLVYIDRDGRLHGQLFGGPPRPLESNGPVADGTWHRFAIVSTPFTQTLFVDGQATGYIESPPVLKGNGNVWLGPRWGIELPELLNDSVGYQGSLDDFRLYPRALFANELMRLDNASP